MGKNWIIDAHCDSLGDYLLEKRDLNRSTRTGHWDLTGAKLGDIGLQFMACFIESEYKPSLAGWRGLQLIEAGLRFVEANKERAFLVKSKEDLSKLGKSDSTGLFLSVEGGEILGESLFMLDIIFKLGVRALGLTWNQRNAIADGIGEKNSKSGLSDFGIEVIKKMNHLGMLVDVSHLNEPGFWDVLELSGKPVVASHSCAAALCDHPRNLSDRQLLALADKKGVVGINFCPDFLNSSGQADCNDVVRHIRHITEVAGIDSVGFGSDFDGITETPRGLESVEKYTNLLDKLAKNGFDEQDLVKICHGNFLRALSEVLP